MSGQLCVVAQGGTEACPYGIIGEGKFSAVDVYPNASEFDNAHAVGFQAGGEEQVGGAALAG